MLSSACFKVDLVTRLRVVSVCVAGEELSIKLLEEDPEKNADYLQALKIKTCENPLFIL